ncbi:MAG: hypothetical protein FD177_643 [Desulfovibrionaceae bacterium]|nr:MAG: hypothetical protein FD177_643 [Desulfovibrionaceae bacterium]
MGHSLVKAILFGSVVLVLSSGCFWYNVDYSVFDSRCKEWVANNSKGIKFDEFVKHTRDMDTRLSYYLCINMVTGNMLVPETIFFDAPEESVAVLADGLMKYKEGIAVWMIVHALQQIQLKGCYDVANDEKAMSAVRVRISMMEHDGWGKMASGKLRWIESQKNN